MYEVYPRSFCDSNGDGIGDLLGIRRHLRYVADLGVEAVWIAPFMRSPQRDFGYDVSDYCDVDPRFGTLADFDAVLRLAHELHLRVLVDLVPAHTSDEHPWFLESRRDRRNARADWYVWSDARPDGGPPNNWLSVFGGSAWQWEPRRGQYYLHHFLPSQPALNHAQPAVSEAILQEAEFWLSRGVDGLRLDAINYCHYDAQLRDNPARAGRGYDLAGRANPYRMQRHLYDKSQPETLGFLQKVRALCARYPGVTTLGEIGDEDPLPLAAAYTAGTDRLHQTYNFGLLRVPLDVAHLRRVLADTAARLVEGWTCWAFSNHDVVRVATRWSPPDAAEPPDALVKLVLGLLLSLRGSVCLYQGDELGLTEAELAYEELQDPYGKTFWPEYVGRDGCRTPMPWQAAAPHGGFCAPEARPWLPVPAEHLLRAVDVQEGQADSVLAVCRRLIALRRREAALMRGAMHVLPVQEQAPMVLAFERGDGAVAGQGGLLCAFNLGPEAARLRLGGYRSLVPLPADHGLRPAQLSGDEAHLPGYSVLYARIGSQAESG